METHIEDTIQIKFNDLVNSYYTPLYRFAYSLAKNEEDAGDLTQQTFLIWARKGKSLKDLSKVKSWLFTTLYREFLRIRRKGNKTNAFEPEILDSYLPPEIPNLTRTIDGKSAVDLLGQVDEIYRIPLSLYFLKDLSYKEIANTLDVPIGTVMSRLSRGKAQLKNLLLKKEIARGLE